MQEQSREAAMPQGTGSSNKCFLKKGDGVARFGMKSSSGKKNKTRRPPPKSSSDTPTSSTQGQQSDKNKVKLAAEIN